MTVVVGYVRSPEGRAAVRRGVAEARLRGLPIAIVHSSVGGGQDDVDDVIAYRTDLEKLQSRLEQAGLQVEVHERVVGNTPAIDLLEVSQELGAELVVIGLRRRSPVGKLVLGSNAQDILLSAEAPVLAVKASAEDTAAGGEPLADLEF